MVFDVLTLFPRMFDGPFSESLLGRSQKAKRLDIRIHNLRDWADDVRHQKVDDRPYGGGAGMVIQAEPVYRALKDLGALKKGKGRPWVVYLSPQGRTLTQGLCEKISQRKHVILICGHYEGIDERVMSWVDEEVSIGDYVLTGGEIPAMVLVDAVSRLVPGVVGDPESVINESFSSGLLDHAHYTRPAVWKGLKVPAVLLSGDHKGIAGWRKAEALKRTKLKRPDILKKR